MGIFKYQKKLRALLLNGNELSILECENFIGLSDLQVSLCLNIAS